MRLPLDKAWDSSDQNQTIEVSDDGNGMTWDMVRDAYLDVGRDRREIDHTDKSPGGACFRVERASASLLDLGLPT